MAEEPHDRSSTRVESFFEPLFARDASGRSWLPALLESTLDGSARFGDLLDNPGSLLTPLAVRGANGRLGCFGYPVVPSRRLLLWFVDHPDKLQWPAQAELSAETVRLRRALLFDEPPGSQIRAQERARALEPVRSPFSAEWWRFEATTKLDCALITDRLVVTVKGRGDAPFAPATQWYPQRSELVGELEAAEQIAKDRQWATLVISEQSFPDVSHDELERALPASAPHLDAAQRAELRAGYLGNLTWTAAREAVGLPSATARA